MTTDPSQHGSEPGSTRGESDGQSEHQPDDRLDETESVDPQARPASRLVDIKGYDIIRELHRGGQGVVYEAVQRSAKRKVAIKVLLEGQLASASARRRFEREVTLAAALKHPNIIAIFDSGEMEDGHKFCVMDYVRGTSIREHIRQNKLSLEDAVEPGKGYADKAGQWRAKLPRPVDQEETTTP